MIFFSKKIEDPDKPDKASCTVSPVADTNKPRSSLVTVLLRNRKKKSLAYQFTFDEVEHKGESVKKFMDVVQRNTKACGRPVEAQVVVGQSDNGKENASKKVAGKAAK